ncbi:phospholipase A1 magnifin [Apis mellifera carnica]|uniref:phospholipase A1 n=1 Tax=Apis mellifera TaxID=7460 RepID=A0A7M7H131_APIME
MSKIYIYLYLIFFLIHKNVINAVCYGKNNPTLVTKIYLKVYKGNSLNPIFFPYMLANVKNISDIILTDQNSILYIHGFLENSEMENVQIPIKSYLDKGDVNVILLDWGNIAFNINYFRVSNIVPMIGKLVAKSLSELHKVIDLNKLHVIGHSLGAHIAAHIGRSMKILNRITGLDPAFPLFYPSECHLRSSDAKAVVILHTDSGFYGTPFNTGTIDFYANKGISPQPGCPPTIGRDLCSHRKSVKIYMESLRNPKAFPAHKCFNNKKDNEVIYFGDSIPPNIHGVYCFNTNLL